VFVVFGAIQLGYPATVIESQSKERRGSLEIMRRARVAETDTRKFNQVVFVCRHGPPSRSYFETATIDNGYSVGDNVAALRKLEGERRWRRTVARRWRLAVLIVCVGWGCRISCSEWRFAQRDDQCSGGVLDR
jgi:hypothetical protein